MDNPKEYQYKVEATTVDSAQIANDGMLRLIVDQDDNLFKELCSMDAPLTLVGKFSIMMENFLIDNDIDYVYYNDADAE